MCLLLKRMDDAHVIMYSVKVQRLCPALVSFFTFDQLPAPALKMRRPVDNYQNCTNLGSVLRKIVFLIGALSSFAERCFFC